MKEKFDLDMPLITFSGESSSASYSLRLACNGTAVFGGIGSGKTSSSSKLIAQRFLKAGMGGLILTCKPDEKKQWVEWCRQTAREKDLIIVEPGAKHYFNFIEYESQNDSGPSYTDNIFELLNTVIEAGKEKAGQKEDSFWSASLQLLLINIIELNLLAYGKVSISTMYDIAQSAPKKSQAEAKEKEDTSAQKDANASSKTEATPEPKTAFQKAVKLAKSNARKKYDDWKEQNQAAIKQLSHEKLDALVEEAVPEYRKVKLLHQYFFQTLINVGEKTRSIVDLIVINFLSMLLRDPIYTIFCKHPSSFTPEHCIEKGKIVLLNFPTKIYRKLGQDIQILCKYSFQRAWEKRDIEKNERPLFIFADEAQNFLHPHDADFQATARSSRVCTCYISQNTSNYYANLSGDNAEHRVKALLGTFGCKIFHANSHIETNEYASQLMGEAYFEDFSRSVSHGEKYQGSSSVSYKLERIVRPEAFFTLLSGGPQNNLQCEAYVVMQGVKFASGMHFKKVKFNQNL